jgi:signal peptidase I
MIKITGKKFWKEFVWWTAAVLIATVLAVLMRVFLFCSFSVPSGSMHPTIETGDFILVNKQIPGPRVYPHFPKARINGKVVTKRFKGIRAIRRNDVVAFNFPYTDREKIDMDLNVNYVKRCVALPGDMFCIENGIYKVKNAPGETLGYAEYQKKFIGNEKGNNGRDWSFPYDTVNYHWTIRNFGPYYIPKKGDCLPVDTVNYRLYGKLITYETDKPLGTREGKVWLGDSIIREYTFRMNCYFMAGDYVFDSVDSRYWGLVPEDHIVGKAIFVWKSKDMKTGKYRWKRFFKRL